jgi:hypothetical protein
MSHFDPKRSLAGSKSRNAAGLCCAGFDMKRSPAVLSIQNNSGPAQGHATRAAWYADQPLGPATAGAF